MHLMETSNVEVCHTGFKKKFVFRVTTPDHEGDKGDVHELVCSASSDQERNEWVSQIQQTIEWMDHKTVHAGGATPAGPSSGKVQPPGKAKKGGWFGGKG